ncbi:NAD(P)-binding Rossmann-fold superfamily protein [Striga asiatica]|uniref:NAD(P)-binding Rossmann-fold superfamily protein n=1 Tax=Striga asiatica TaxID=4170 RepID=A0A5A7Q0P2_STRAF|nr:NAD(P)-binding Rossmann-fold superfamily protein [Striga asiatica]
MFEGCFLFASDSRRGHQLSERYVVRDDVKKIRQIPGKNIYVAGCGISKQTDAIHILLAKNAHLFSDARDVGKYFDSLEDHYGTSFYIVSNGTHGIFGVAVIGNEKDKYMFIDDFEYDYEVMGVSVKKEVIYVFIDQFVRRFCLLSIPEGVMLLRNVVCVVASQHAGCGGHVACTITVLPLFLYLRFFNDYDLKLFLMFFAVQYVGEDGVNEYLPHGESTNIYRLNETVYDLKNLINSLMERLSRIFPVHREMGLSREGNGGKKIRAFYLLKKWQWLQATQ